MGGGFFNLHFKRKILCPLWGGCVLYKKLLALVAAFALGAQFVSAYNPLPGGEDLFLFGYPGLIAGGLSTAGGGLFNATPASVLLNPALTAPLQRVAADFGWAGFFQDDDDYEDGAGGAFQLGALFPSKWGVWTASVQAAFMPIDQMPFGNMIVGRASWSRDITDNLYVGASVFVGSIDDDKAAKESVAAAVDFGVVYRIGALAFFRDARVSAVIANIGTMYRSDYYADFPSPFTLRGGFAALFLDPQKVNPDKITAGISADVSIPGFQNFLFSFAAQATIWKIVTVSVGWDTNVAEFSKIPENAVHSPFVSVGVNLTLDTGKIERARQKFDKALLENPDFNAENYQGWEKSDFTFSAMGQQIHSKVFMMSVGASAQFGQRDTEAPLINIGEAE
jgi:hypothetical protein